MLPKAELVDEQLATSHKEQQYKQSLDLNPKLFDTNEIYRLTKEDKVKKNAIDGELDIAM